MMDLTPAGTPPTFRSRRIRGWLSPLVVLFLVMPLWFAGAAQAGSPAATGQVASLAEAGALTEVASLTEAGALTVRAGALAAPGQAAATTAPEAVKWYRVAPSFGGEPEFLYAIAERFLGSGDRNPEIFELNEGRLQPGGLRMTSPAVIEPGWILVLPPDAEGEGVQFGPLPTVAAVPTAPPRLPITDGPVAGDAAVEPAAKPSAEGTGPGPLTVGLVAVVLLLVAAGGFIVWRRRSTPAPAPASVLTPAGAESRRPARSAAASGAASAVKPSARRGFRLPWVRATGPGALPGHFDTAASWTVDRALRVLATACAGSGQAFPEFYAVSLDDHRVVLRLTSPGSAPLAPWRITDDGLGWEAPLRQLQAAPIDPELSLPGLRLVTLGTVDGARMLLDLGRCTGVIGLAGEPRATRALVTTWVTELVGSPWSDQVRVVLAGVREVPVPAGAEDRVTAVAGLREVPASVVDADVADPDVADLDDDGRAAEPETGNAATGVLILGGPPPAREVERMQPLLTGQRPGWAVVILGADVDARWSLTLHPNGDLDTGVLGIRVHTGETSTPTGR